MSIQVTVSGTTPTKYDLPNSEVLDLLFDSDDGVLARELSAPPVNTVTLSLGKSSYATDMPTIGFVSGLSFFLSTKCFF